MAVYLPKKAIFARSLATTARYARSLVVKLLSLLSWGVGVATQMQADSAEGAARAPQDRQRAGTRGGCSQLRRVCWTPRVPQPLTMRAAPPSPTHVPSAPSGVQPCTLSASRDVCLHPACGMHQQLYHLSYPFHFWKSIHTIHPKNDV